MTDPTPQPRKPGRPRRETSVASVRLTHETYDALYAYARFHRVDVSNVIRAAIEQHIVAERRQIPR